MSDEMPERRNIVIVKVEPDPLLDEWRVYEAPEESRRYTLINPDEGRRLREALHGALAVGRALNGSVDVDCEVYCDLVMCPRCSGLGEIGGPHAIGKPPHPSATCSDCKGTGKVSSAWARGVRMMMETRSPDIASSKVDCPVCNGTRVLTTRRARSRRIIQNPCPSCSGTGKVTQEQHDALLSAEDLEDDGQPVPLPPVEEAGKVESAEPLKPQVFGMESWPLPDGSMPTGFYVIVLGLDKDGRHTFWTRTNGLSQMEVVGALDVMAELERKSQAANWHPVNPEDYQ